MRDYTAHEIPEYWIVDPIHKAVEQYLLENKSYYLHQKVTEGNITASQIPGFKLEVENLFTDL